MQRNRAFLAAEPCGDVRRNVLHKVDGPEYPAQDVQLNPNPIGDAQKDNARPQADAPKDGAKLALDHAGGHDPRGGRGVHGGLEVLAHHELHDEEVEDAGHNGHNAHPHRVPHKRHLVRNPDNDVCGVPDKERHAPDVGGHELHEQERNGVEPHLLREVAYDGRDCENGDVVAGDNSHKRRDDPEVRVEFLGGGTALANGEQREKLKGPRAVKADGHVREPKEDDNDGVRLDVLVPF